MEERKVFAFQCYFISEMNISFSGSAMFVNLASRVITAYLLLLVVAGMINQFPLFLWNTEKGTSLTLLTTFSSFYHYYFLIMYTPRAIMKAWFLQKLNHR